MSCPPNQPLKGFDPAAKCVALEKKAAFKSKPSNIEVIMVCYKSTIPRGKARKMLGSEGKVQKIEFLREMSNCEVIIVCCRTSTTFIISLVSPFWSLIKVASFILVKTKSLMGNIFSRWQEKIWANLYLSYFG